MIKSASKYLFLIAGILPVMLLQSCGRSEKRQQDGETATEVAVTTYAPLDAFYKIDSEAGRQIENWKEFWSLEKEMKNFRETRSGDLGFITDELIRIEGTLMNDSIQEKVNVPAVKSRVLVFRTFVNKLKDQISHRVPVADIDTTRFKILESYNAFRYQVSDALRDKVYEDFLNRDSLETGAADPERN